ncbi:hypothetical protein RUM44_012389 [Polyplax serrata]|uniref:SAP domain-containing protein n=1 Tax=Polyplax serrata TaxID=468196 RepID=A0ABR1BFE6_POLSC
MGMKRINQKSKSSGNLRHDVDSLDLYKKHGFDKLLPQMTSLTKDQLKGELKKRGLKITGTKNELLQRLGNVMASVKKKAEIFNSSQVNGNTRKPNSRMINSQQRKGEERVEREKIVIWRRPIQTTTYFLRELNYTRIAFAEKAKKYRASLIISILLLVLFFILLHTNGPHQFYFQLVRGKAVWCLYWLGLGVLSSVGLGTGLHTFLLYLGPHIASVTLAAYECGTLNFPEPPYPDEIICPDKSDPTWAPSIFNIMSKVRLEAMMWGVGTALGELPPYFMARAARMSGYDPDDKEDLKEFEELRKKKQNASTLSTLDRAKLFVEKLVEKVGFFGILACASIPNPLFDLAGITCGHFLVPFWTFFGATVLGKAVIKMHIQKMFVIIAFNETLVEKAVFILGYIPSIGHKLQEPFKAFLLRQKLRLHRRSEAEVPGDGNILASIFEKFVVVMVIYFVLSIVNSMAQSYYKRLCKERRNVKHKD